MKIYPHECELVLRGQSDGMGIEISKPIREMNIQAVDWPQYASLADRDVSFKLIEKEELRIWTPDGIGDLHWVFLKLGALKKACGAKKLTICKHSVPKARDYFARSHRSRSFVEMNPIVDVLEEVEESIPVLEEGFILNEGPYDYVLDPTLFLHRCQSIEQWMPSLPIDWNYFKTLKVWDLEVWDVAVDQTPKYPIVYFGDRYAEVTWAGTWSDSDWAEITNDICQVYGIPCALGLNSDMSKAKGVEAIGAMFTNKVGLTNLWDCILMLRDASIVVGSISGLTILSAAMGVPTIALWPDERSLISLPPIMRANWLPKDKVNRTYFPLPYSVHPDKVKEAVRKCSKIS